MKLLNKYNNGNCTIEIYSDGTRITEWPDNEPLKLEYPLNVDIRLMTKCPYGLNPKTGKAVCSFCHESATTDGKECDYDALLKQLEGLPKGAEISGAGHLTSFIGTDTIPAINYLKGWYGSNSLIGSSISATEHSVMSSHGLNELETFRYLIEDVYPTGFVSIVSDTYDFWKNVTETLPELRSKIMARDGKVVIRPDSGDPVKIICGDPNAEPDTCESVGLIESLWVIFGGKVNSKGYKVLDPHIGAIYGDSITLDRFEEILRQLKAKGFASSNIVVGVGSFTYAYNTRDTFGFAVKSTYSIVNGEERFLFKDPKTDDGTKRSQRGMVAVLNNGTEFKDGLGVVGITDLYLENELSLVFNNGELKKHFTLDQIRENVDKELELH